MVYTGKDPAVVGLGPTAIRDYISYIKQDGEVKRAIGFGTSQSGRFLRNFVYDGSTSTSRAAKCSTASGRTWRARLAGTSTIVLRSLRATECPASISFTPWNFTVHRPAGNRWRDADAILARSAKAGVVPKIFYSNGSFEYWGRAASLIHTSPDGKSDAVQAPNTRIYYLAERSTARTPGPNAP